MTTVKNLFVHWIKEIERRRLGDGLQIILSLPVAIYRLFEAMLTQKNKRSIRKRQQYMQKLQIAGRKNNTVTPLNRPDLNFTQKNKKFPKLISQDGLLRSQLSFLSDIGLVNPPHKSRSKKFCALEKKISQSSTLQKLSTLLHVTSHSNLMTCISSIIGKLLFP